MWEMYEEPGDLEVECDNECGVGPPPPLFNLPPPPRPDFMQEFTTCSETSSSDYEEMCEAIPILDASSLNPSLQSSAMILLCTVLLLIFIFISSIFIWKHKRKVQNFLPGKNNSRGALDSHQALARGGQSLTYEDPRDTLVMRPYPLNTEMLSAKTFHYASSGIPMQCSPPLFSSPGPDPYRSNDNVYEELEHRNSEMVTRPLHKSATNTTVATIYQENSGGAGASGTYLDRNRVERNSLLSSASSSIHGGSINESNFLHHTLGNNLHSFTSSRRGDRTRRSSGFKSSNSDHIDLSGDTNNNKNDQGDGGESEVERLNRRNAQLSHGTSNRPTRANYYVPPPQHIIAINNQISARINPQTEARENFINNNSSTTYDDTYMTSAAGAYDESGNQIYHHPYSMTTFRSYNNLNNPHQPLYNCNAMGSDSGYSQNTQASDGRSLRGRPRKSNKNNTMGNMSRGIRHFHHHGNAANNYDGDS